MNFLELGLERQCPIKNIGILPVGGPDLD